MKTITIFATTALLAIGFASLQACGGDDTTTSTTTGTTSTTSTTTGTGGSGTGGSGTGGSMGNPPPPVLGAQLERMGKPAINTALNHAFDGDAAKAGMAKDAWNTEGDESKWVTSFAAEVKGNLAIIDSLDTKCGNQFGADLDPAKRYGALAGILANDKLWVNTDGMACTQYLAAEATAVGLPLGGDCGGRKLDYDVIDASYSVLAAGALGGVSDNIPADADTKGAEFPYLAKPH